MTAEQAKEMNRDKKSTNIRYVEVKESTPPAKPLTGAAAIAAAKKAEAAKK